MIKMSIGFILGVIVATVGFRGVADLADNGLTSAKTSLQQQVKAQPVVAQVPEQK